MAFKFPANKDDVYPQNRQMAFNKIQKSIKKYLYASLDDLLLGYGDSLEVIKSLPNDSIDLVLTDPPYHSTKKKNIYGDSNFSEDRDFLDWLSRYLSEWKRVLRPNGSLYMFCSSDMAPFIFVAFSREMNMHNIIAWSKPNEPGYDGWKQKMKKTSLRRWYPHSERIIFCSPSIDTNLKKSPLGDFLKKCRKECSLTANELTEKIGAYGKINNGGAVSNWETGRNIPSREQYQRICKVFTKTKKILLMPVYEDVVRAFNLNPSKAFIDVWDHENVRQYRGKHPAEKPLDLLEQIILTSSYEGDVVLDCFSGSGATMLAAQNTKRRSLGIEIDFDWITYSKSRIEKENANINKKFKTEKLSVRNNTRKKLPLFPNF